MFLFASKLDFHEQSIEFCFEERQDYSYYAFSQERRRLDSQKDDVSLTEQDKEELQFARESIERQRREHFVCNFCRRATSLDKDRCAHKAAMEDNERWIGVTKSL